MSAHDSLGGAYVPQLNYTRTGATDTGGTYVDATFENVTVNGELGSDDVFRLIGQGYSLVMSGAPAGGILYGEDIAETYSLGAWDPIDGSGLIQRFLYGMFINLYTEFLSLTNSDGTDVVQPLTLEEDGSVTLGGLRPITATNVLTVPSLACQAVAFANLGTAPDGTLVYCSNCLVGSNPASGASTGAFAKRLNGIWRCD